MGPGTVAIGLVPTNLGTISAPLLLLSIRSTLYVLPLIGAMQWAPVSQYVRPNAGSVTPPATPLVCVLVKLSIEAEALVKANRRLVLVALSAEPVRLTLELVLLMEVGKPEPLMPV